MESPVEVGQPEAPVAPTEPPAPGETEEEFECPVCMEDSIKRVWLECKHVMCFECARKWQSTAKHTCPMCRAPSRVLSHLKSRCPKRNELGVSIVSTKRSRSRVQHFRCHGCSDYFALKEGRLHRECKTRTCKDCVRLGMNMAGAKCCTCLSKLVLGTTGVPDHLEGGILENYGAALVMTTTPVLTYLDLTQDDSVPVPIPLPSGTETAHRSTSASLVLT